MLARQPSPMLQRQMHRFRAFVPAAQAHARRACSATQRHHSNSVAIAAAATTTQLSPEQLNLESWRSQLQLYNTLTRQKETFQPRPDNGDNVQMYVCGVTVYDYSHIGHARVYVAFDVLYRLLRYLRYDVQYVRNFTDIDDKIIKRANEAGEDPLALSARFIEEFHKDMQLLQCLSPSLEPKATDYIPQMISTIERIIANGHGYAVDGDVYFDVASLPSYGRLSGRNQEDNRAGERVAVDDRKRGAADFALWKAAKSGEPQWPSPWGPGRPGWHIECSAMIESIMGNSIDIHGGGRDLVFPHHENELAQSEAAAGGCSCGGDHGQHQHEQQQQQQQGGGAAGEEGRGFVRYWLHNGFVNVDSEKMSKSLGNFFTIRDVLKQYHPLALRWFLVNTQYRQPVNYTQRALDEASDRVYYVYQSLQDLQQALQAAGAEGEQAAAGAAGSKEATELLAAVVTALLDDLNTPSAVAALSAPLKTINDLLFTKAGKKAKGRLDTLAGIQQGIQQVLTLLGMHTEDVGATLQQLRELALVRAGLSEADVAAALQQRAEARAAKDFARGDEIRVQLAAKGVLVMDTPQGSTWRPGLAQQQA